MTHLGERISELVDGQMSPEAAERANAHLASCSACREAAEVERLTKHRLRALPDVAPTPAFLSTLMQIGGPAGPLAPRAAHVPGSPRPTTVPVGYGPTGSRRPGGSGPAAWRPAGSASASRRNRRRGPRRIAAAVVGALSVVGVGVVGLVVATSPVAAPAVTPAIDAFVVEHATTTGSLPFADQQVAWLTGGEAGK